MNILFICTLGNVGGIETLMLRLAQNLKVNVLILPYGRDFASELREKFEQTNAKIINGVDSLGKTLLFGVNNKIIRKICEAVDNKPIDLIYTFNSPEMILGLFLKSNYFKNSKVMQGIYHPNEYSWIPKINNFQSVIYKKIYNSCSLSNFIFMNEECVNSHLALRDEKFEHYNIVPLPVELSRFYNVKRKPKIYKVLSVGRITNFKTYNFTMIPIVKYLLDQNIPIQYHIYGHGNESKKLINEINANNMQNHIFFHGKVDYGDEYLKELSEAYVFVGMGTAIIEACAAGVPSILATAGCRKGLTLGWFHLIDGFNVGEPRNSENELEIRDLLFNLFTGNYNYYELERLSRVKATKFDLNKNLLLMARLVRNASGFTIRPLIFKLIAIGMMLDKLIFHTIFKIDPNKDKYKI